MKKTGKEIVISAAVASLLMGSTAMASDLFKAKELKSGYQLASHHEEGEKKCKSKDCKHNKKASDEEKKCKSKDCKHDKKAADEEKKCKSKECKSKECKAKDEEKKCNAEKKCGEGSCGSKEKK
ncbi:MAG: hypothetical protein IPJ69_06910 [Deltaproteobacteria bacterium]|nr:MAG: hypothetical protein IPJ69_06910 [Deltaproteobacteria bacterium]